MSKRTALIDADILVFQAAQKAEVPTNWGKPEGSDFDLWTLHAEFQPALEHMVAMIGSIQDTLGADEVVLALTDPVNWRKEVLPSYKSNRADKRKPMLLPALRDYILALSDFPGMRPYMKPGLEGDDVLGILMTHRSAIPGEKICVSLDKDMKTIPGFHYNQGKPERGIFEVSPQEADEWHMRQTLSGDATDGYSGCPGIGVQKAEEIVKERLAAVMTERTISRGPRKGQVVVEPVMVSMEPDDATLWSIVVSHYVAAGLTWDEALVQARVARILRNTDFDYKTGRPILWQP